jgi:hypothetical protein
MNAEIPYIRKNVKGWHVIARAIVAGESFYYDGCYFNAKSPLEAKPLHYGIFLQMDFSDVVAASVECIFLDEFVQIYFDELEMINFILKFRVPEQIEAFSWGVIPDRTSIPTFGSCHPYCKSIKLTILEAWEIISKKRDPENITLQDAWEIIWVEKGDDYR